MPEADREPDGLPLERPVGLPAVLLVAGGVVVLVLGLAVATSLLPEAVQEVLFRTPLAIVVLVVSTLGVLAGLARRRPTG